MINSIQHFTESGIKNLEAIKENFMRNPKDIASFVNNSKEEFIKFLVEYLGETFTECDQMLRDSMKRTLDYVIVKRDRKSLITSVGEIHFEKTLFKNKETGIREYLLDRILGIEPNERMTEDAEERLLYEAVQTSYRRAGEECSILDSVSKQTVMNKLHGLMFPPLKAIPAAKKIVDYLYIDADEDHIALQYRDKKGDLVTNGQGRKKNNVLAKLVYVYEGVEAESPKSCRHRLINPYYFSGIYKGKDNQKLWDSVYEYMDSHYDLSKVKIIYLNSDGGGWIKEGASRFSGVVKVLDGFHLSQYLFKMTGHLLDSASDACDELRDAIKNGSKPSFISVVDKVLIYAETDKARARINNCRDYILNNWKPAKARLHSRDKVHGCSAEGHVSHVLASRMSSRPMGWSLKGGDKMARLRAYYWNKGDILNLVRFQKENHLLASGGEDIVLSASEIFLSEGCKENNDIGKYADVMRASLSSDAKKYVWFNANIWGL